MAGKNKSKFVNLEDIVKVSGFEPVPIPETIDFLGREEEFSKFQSFIDSPNKRILEIYGVPMIGKTSFSQTFCEKNNIANIRIRFKPKPSTPYLDIIEQFFKNQERNDFSRVVPNTLIIIENFEQALEWSSKGDHLHEIKDAEVSNFINSIMSKSDLKLVIESRFQTRFDNSYRKNVQSEKLEGIPTDLFLEYYIAKNFSIEQFDLLCQKFNNHTALLALAYNDSPFLYDNQLLKAISEPTATSQNLWKMLEGIIRKLQKPEKQLLAALTLLQRPVTRVELEKYLLGYFKGDIEQYLMSLRKKLLATSSIEAEYCLNPYIAEVCYSFFERSEEIKDLKKLASFREVPAPEYDPIKQASYKGDYPTFYRLVKELRLSKKFKEVHEVLNYTLENDRIIKKAGVLNEIGVTYKLEKNYIKAKEIFEQACKLRNIPSFTELAIVYKEEKNYEEAKNVLRRALKIESKNVRILNELAIIYKIEGNYIEAITELEKLREIKHIPSFTELAICHKEMKNYGKAKEVLEEGLVIEPKNVKILGELAMIFSEEKEFDKAEEILKKSLEIDSKDSITHGQLATVRKARRNFMNSKKLLKQPFKIASNDTSLKGLKDAERQQIEIQNNVPKAKNQNSARLSKKIIFLTADPGNMNPIGASEQKQKIEDMVGKDWDFKDNLHTKYNEIEGLVKDKNIIHITTHCKNNELIFVHDKLENEANSLTAEYLCYQLKESGEIKELIMLIACKSETIAEQLISNKLTKYAIATTTAISKQSAIEFSAMFYKQLKSRDDITFAFNQACFHLNQDQFRARHDDGGDLYDYKKVYKLFQDKKL
jgi:tetratricopeptide (TPR) repeat protein